MGEVFWTSYHLLDGYAHDEDRGHTDHGDGFPEPVGPGVGARVVHLARSLLLH